jgi:hypothetical protein
LVSQDIVGIVILLELDGPTVNTGLSFVIGNWEETGKGGRRAVDLTPAESDSGTWRVSS